MCLLYVVLARRHLVIECEKDVFFNGIIMLHSYICLVYFQKSRKVIQFHAETLHFHAGPALLKRQLVYLTGRQDIHSCSHIEHCLPIRVVHLFEFALTHQTLPLSCADITSYETLFSRVCHCSDLARVTLCGIGQKTLMTSLLVYMDKSRTDIFLKLFF